MEQPTPNRITMRTIWHGMLDIFSLERGLIQTTVSLTKRPGQAIREYLLEDRERLMPPFRFLIFMVAIATFITVQYFEYDQTWKKQIESGFEHGYNDKAESDEKADEFTKIYLEKSTYLFNNYFNLFILLSVPVAALVTMWLFRRRFNYAEHLVINSYVSGYLTVVYIVISPLLFVTDFITLSAIYTVITFIYSVIVYKKVYQSAGIPGTVASLGAVVLYFLLYYIFVIFIFIGIAIIAMVQSS